MAPVGGGRWERKVRLPEGRYEARYYAGDGERVIYYGPALGGTAVGTNGLDAVFEVSSNEPDSARLAAEADDARDGEAPLRALLAAMPLTGLLAAG
jgi:hypothetical protein